MRGRAEPGGGVRSKYAGGYGIRARTAARPSAGECDARAAGCERLVRRVLAAELRRTGVRGAIAAGVVPNFLGDSAAEGRGAAVRRDVGSCTASPRVVFVAHGGLAWRRSFDGEGCAGPAVQSVF